jgi:outer membrane protein
MRTSLLSLLAGCLLTVAVSAGAQDFKIGYVNSERLLRDSVPAKAAFDKLQAEFSKREKDLNEMGARIKATSDKLDKDSPTLTESDRARRQRDLVEQDREFQRKRRELQEDFSQRKYEEQTALFERANKVIKQIFDKEKYDLIVQDAVFASPRIDITDKVIGTLNAQAAGK